MDTQAPGTQRGQAQSIPLQKELITSGNITRVKTSVPLRLRAETVRATCKRYWESFENFKLRKFEWEKAEGNGNAVKRQANLLRYIEQHTALIEQCARAIRSCESATRRLARAKRRGSDRYQDWCQLNDAIAEELARREGEAGPPARANLEKSVQPPVLQYPVQFATDVKRIERKWAAEEHVVRRPTFNEKLRAAVTVAYQSNELAKAKRIQYQLA